MKELWIILLIMIVESETCEKKKITMQVILVKNYFAVRKPQSNTLVITTYKVCISTNIRMWYKKFDLSASCW